MTNTRFKPEEHLIDIKGKKYLPVAARLIWFREDHPDYSIETEIIERIEGGAILKATIKNAEGQVLSTAHKMETKQGFSDYLEKAETGSIGRGLALIGYGTQFTLDLEEGNRLADAPQTTKKPATGAVSAPKAPAKPPFTLSATDKQLSAIGFIGVKMGKNMDEVMDQLCKVYKVETVEEITKQQASDVIGGKVDLFPEDTNNEPAGNDKEKPKDIPW